MGNFLFDESMLAEKMSRRPLQGCVKLTTRLDSIFGRRSQRFLLLLAAAVGVVLNSSCLLHDWLKDREMGISWLGRWQKSTAKSQSVRWKIYTKYGLQYAIMRSGKASERKSDVDEKSWRNATSKTPYCL